MLYFLLISLLSAGLVNSDLLNFKCDDYKTEESCLSHIYCGWCNNTNNYSKNYSKNYSNNSFTCNTIGICSSYDNCNTNKDAMCVNFNLFLKIVIIFILICVIFTILLTISNMLKRTNVNDVVKIIILVIFGAIIIVPIVALYYYHPTYFIYLFIGDIALCILIWVLYGGRMIIYNNSNYMNQYTPINQNMTDVETVSSYN